MVRRFADLGSESPVGRIPTAKFAHCGRWNAVGRSGKAPNVRWRVENPDKSAVLQQHRRRYSRRCRLTLSRIDDH